MEGWGSDSSPWTGAHEDKSLAPQRSVITASPRLDWSMRRHTACARMNGALNHARHRHLSSSNNPPTLRLSQPSHHASEPFSA
jgi:hypothetical protein